LHARGRKIRKRVDDLARLRDSAVIVFSKVVPFRNRGVNNGGERVQIEGLLQFSQALFAPADNFETCEILRLVFLPYGNEWYLVGIVRDVWTM